MLRQCCLERVEPPQKGPRSSRPATHPSTRLARARAHHTHPRARARTSTHTEINSQWSAPLQQVFSGPRAGQWPMWPMAADWQPMAADGHSARSKWLCSVKMVLQRFRLAVSLPPSSRCTRLNAPPSLAVQCQDSDETDCIRGCLHPRTQAYTCAHVRTHALAH